MRPTLPLRFRATTKPSPPLLPLPQSTHTRPGDFAFRSLYFSRKTSATLLPAASIKRSPGMLKRSVVRRSTSRISAAVRAFIAKPAGWGLEHPSAAHVEHLAGDILGFLGSEEGDGSGHVFHRRGTSNRIAGVAQFTRLLHGQVLFVHAGGVDHVHSNSIFSFFQGERTR